MKIIQFKMIICLKEPQNGSASLSDSNKKKVILQKWSAKRMKSTNDVKKLDEGRDDTRKIDEN